MERFAKATTGTIVALGLVLGAVTSASAFNPQPEPPGAQAPNNAMPPSSQGYVNPGTPREYVNPGTPESYLKPGKPAEFNKMRKAPQTPKRLYKPLR